MSRPVLYTTDASPPCRAVLLTAAALGVELDCRETDLKTQANLDPKFVKMNPQHTVPTLDDNGFVLWDSHAIMCYLVTKYGKNDSLYPKDPQIRAKIDQFLHFETGYLFSALRYIGRPMFLHGNTDVPAEKVEILNNALEIFDKLLEGRKWLVGDSFTLADISCVSTMSSLTAFRPVDKYPNIRAWLKTCEENLPAYAEKNAPGNEKLHGIIRSILPKPL